MKIVIKKKTTISRTAGVSNKPMKRKVQDVTDYNALDNMGYQCMDQAIIIFGDRKEDPDVWVWQNKNGHRVLFYDEGDDKCSFIREIDTLVKV
jgi:hypothetical protein